MFNKILWSMYINLIPSSLFYNFILHSNKMQQPLAIKVSLAHNRVIMMTLEEINELVAQSRFAEAKTELEALLETEANNFEIKKLLGLVNINLDLMTEAKENFEDVVKYNPEDATSWFYLGNCYDSIGELSASEFAYLKVTELRPDYADAYKNLALLYMKQGNFQKTVDYSQIGAELEPEDHLFPYMIGTALMAGKDFENAILFLKKSVELSGNNPQMINSLGTCYLTIGQHQKALEIYLEALASNPNDALTNYNTGSVYQILNQHEKACEYFEKANAIEDAESFQVAWALSLMKLNKPVEAIELYKKLAVAHPEKPNYRYNMVLCYEAMGDLQTAIKLLENIIMLNPKFIMPAQKLAGLYIETGELRKAKDIYDRVILKNKVNAEVFYQYAILSTQLCDTDTAEKILKKVIKMDPNAAKAHKDLGVIYLGKRLFDWAEDEFSTALKLAPNDFDIVFEYANYLHSIANYKEADEYYERAMKIDANSIAKTFLALNRIALNNLESAKELITDALHATHEHEYILFVAGRVYYALKDYENAKMYLIKALEKKISDDTMNLLGLTYFELGEFEKANNIFLNLLDKNDKNTVLLLNSAKCYEQMDEQDNALTQAEKLLEIFPDCEDALELIRRVS